MQRRSIFSCRLVLTALIALTVAVGAVHAAESAKDDKEAARRAAIRAEEARRKKATADQIKLLEALGGERKIKKVEPREKVGQSTRIRPTTPRATKTVNWKQSFQKMGEIKDTNKIKSYGRGRSATYTVEPEPVKIEFVTEQDVWRLMWKTLPTTRSGKLKIELSKKLTTSSGLTKWQPFTRIPAVRAGASSGKILQGKGEYMLSLTGLNVKYEFTVEEAHVSVDDPSEKLEDPDMKKDDADKADAKPEAKVAEAKAAEAKKADAK